MSKLILLFLTILSFSNSAVIYKESTYTPILEITDSNYCYSRRAYLNDIITSNGSAYSTYYCGDLNITTASATITKRYTCSQFVNDDNFASTQTKRKSWIIEKKLCSEVDQEFDEDGNPIVFVDGIPFDKTFIDNALYYDPYNDILECNTSYYNVNNSSCLKPDYNVRNLADLMIKAEKIVESDSNYTSFSVIADSITYKNNDESQGIESANVSFETSDGSVNIAVVTLSEDDPLYTVNEDKTITSTEYTATDTSTDNTSTSNSTTDSSTEQIVTALDKLATKDDVQDVVDNTAVTNLYIKQSNEHLSEIEKYQNAIYTTLNPSDSDIEAVKPVNPLENVDVQFDEDFIPQIQEFITNAFDNFTTLKDTYEEKYDFISENGFTFDYNHQLYDTCALNNDLEIFNQTIEFNIDVCELMSNVNIPDSDYNALNFFHIIFYNFFYFIILIAIIRFAILILSLRFN